MVNFLLKGLVRDRSRSLFPVLVVVAGVFLTVLMHSWIQGAVTNMLDTTAAFDTGHLKVMTREYAELQDPSAIDLALADADSLLRGLKERYPDLLWVPRIRFAGLVDVGDSLGVTRAQGPVVGMGVQLLTDKSPEVNLLQLQKALVSGRLPKKKGEALLTSDFVKQLGIHPGESVTLITSTMFGSSSFYSFKVVGTLHFGIAPMDRGMLVVDLEDAQFVLDMNNMVSEVLGFFPDRVYRDKEATQMASHFNQEFSDSADEFTPYMSTLRKISGLDQLLDMLDYFGTVVAAIFVFAMSIVLWNAGLMGSLRRYGEIGLRLALGESKSEVYRSLLYESFLIGVFGSFVGTCIGLAIAYYIQVHGVNFEGLMKSSTVMISSVMRTKITPTTYYIGFLPGLLATLLGSAIAGIGIYKRQTSQLFKELEA